MRIVDLRSDTVTEPTERMRRAMYQARLGDDVFGEDPTMNRLEQIACQKVGKSAALFVPSGTMGNLVSILSHCGRGDEVVLGDQSHTFLNETGGMSAFGGVHPHTIPNDEDGTIPIGRILSAIREKNVHHPETKLICIENTHNRCSGAPLTSRYTKEVCDLAGEHGLKVHLDGARIFNAAVALGVDPKDLTGRVDSLIFCFSKGLSAPVGSVICGDRPFIERARKIRKALGGGMRQCGIIAAAGIVALDEMVERLEQDHKNAHRLAVGISGIHGLKIDVSSVKTNILYTDLIPGKLTPQILLRNLERGGVKILQTGPARFRLVTHFGVEREDIDYTIDVLRETLKDHVLR
jgi:threonine aldolase